MYPPIVINYYKNNKLYLYYKDSNIFTELKIVLDDLIRYFFSEVVMNSASVPVIVTDSTQRNIIEVGNIPEKKRQDTVYLRQTLESMASQNTPIEVNLAGTGIRYIFYKDSSSLPSCGIIPIVQFAVIGVFLFIAYLLFSFARRSEQNQVWVGWPRRPPTSSGRRFRAW